MSSVNDRALVDYVVIPPDGGWGWCVVCVAFVWNLLVDGTCYSFPIFLPEMMADFRVEQRVMVTASSVQMGLYFLLGPFVAAAINRFGFRIVSILSGLMAFGGLLAAAYIRQISAFVAVFGGVVGAAFSFAYLSNILVVGFYFAKYRAVATCIAVTGNPVGVSVVPTVLAVLVKGVGWREKCKYLSGAHLLMALLALAYRKLPPSEVVVEAGGKAEASATSLWGEWERERRVRGNADYPTNAEVLGSAEYTVVAPDELRLREDSGSSARSIRTNAKSITSANRQTSEDVPKYQRRKVCCCHWRCRYVLCLCLWHDHRPMYRDDILYHGSTGRLSQYQHAGGARYRYHMTVTRTAHAADVPENADCANCCPESVIRVLATMFGCRLLRSCAFCLLCLSGFLSYLGLYAPYMHGIELSIAKNVSQVDASYILTAIGVSNAAGRVTAGVLSMAVPKLQPMILSQVTLIIAGAAVIAHPFFSSFAAHLTCACVFGLNISTLSSLRTLVVVDLLGLEKLTNAFGLIVLLEGLSSLMAMPLNACLVQAFDDLKAPFVFGGVMIVISGVVLIPVDAVNKWDARQQTKREARRRLKAYEQARQIATRQAPRR